MLRRAGSGSGSGVGSEATGRVVTSTFIAGIVSGSWLRILSFEFFFVLLGFKARLGDWDGCGHESWDIVRGRRVKKSVIGLAALPVAFVVDFGMVALDKARLR